ncbi:histidinol-phosphate aminotransferase [Caedimonas varicaedens]|jgi:histidinol-phosphate aminotransferase|uniref:Histidinol-phosphate aminotransferase n=1 Tax=Caedimonas varicaedens TaxID=1629334 RepID=A0A0K8MDJ9_9PROT|nr:histidinol-phosphate aminotransferase [Caedimonas varicaedens]
MSSITHPQARGSLSGLDLPGPIKKIYYTENAYRFDLSNSTNPYAGTYGEYPSLNPLELKSLYLETISNINTNFYPDIKFPKVAQDQLLFTVGSIEGIDLVLRSFCEPHKDSICTLDPTFPAYAHWAKIHGVRVKSVPMRGDTFGYIDVQEITRENPKILFICNPNNPTGTIIQNETILKICHSINGLVVVDEAYIEFSEQPSMLQYLSATKNLIILRTLSKAWGMAGLRCGVVLADPEIINTLRYIQIPFGLSSPSQKLIRKELENPTKIIDSWQKIKNERDRLFSILSQMKAIKKIYKSHTNFMLMQLNNYAFYMQELQKADVCVADCTHILSDSIKVSISTPTAHRVFIKALSRT